VGVGAGVPAEVARGRGTRSRRRQPRKRTRNAVELFSQGSAKPEQLRRSLLVAQPTQERGVPTQYGLPRKSETAARDGFTLDAQPFSAAMQVEPRTNPKSPSTPMRSFCGFISTACFKFRDHLRLDTGNTPDELSRSRANRPSAACRWRFTQAYGADIRQDVHAMFIGLNRASSLD